ncbi:low affinity iron permease family protein [Phenylobacterium sp.]|jgi:low affinity Fe/Cu permease|uniref:low affinity iron permease family protein n=1 Tax=Phenylobacterium sp. TaxID=1871053 RepID=UPI002F958DFC
MADKSPWHHLTRLGAMTGHPAAFLVLGLYTVAWVVFDRESMDMHGIATLVTWLMTLFIQRAETRDTQALQAKIDELLRAFPEARTEMARLDELEPNEIMARRDRDRDGMPDPA